MTGTVTVFELAYEVAGKPVWSLTTQSGGTLPWYVPMKQGQSAADAIREATDKDKPTLDWFLTQHIPREILADNAPLGTSPLAPTTGRSRNGK